MKLIEVKRVGDGEIYIATYRELRHPNSFVGINQTYKWKCEQTAQQLANENGLTLTGESAQLVNSYVFEVK